MRLLQTENVRGSNPCTATKFIPDFMKILILEDDDNRIRKFKQNFIGCDLYITHLTSQAINWLKEIEFDVVFLDCDLLPEHYDMSKWATMDCSEFDSSSGVAVGKFLGSNLHINPQAQIIIHSMNPVGSRRISDYCKERSPERIPYHILWQSLIIA